MIFLRSLLFALIQSTSTVPFFVAGLLVAPFGLAARFRVISLWARSMVHVLRWVCGIRYVVEGRENLPAEPSVVMSKHQSAWETLAFQAILPPHVWVLKRELLAIPVFGWGLRLLSPIAIDRGAGMAALKQTFEQGRDRLSRGYWVIVFPEGTRVAPGQRGKYQAGAGFLATQTGAPVVPVAHNAGFLWGRNSFLKRPGLVTVVIGPPIDPKGLKPQQLMSRVEDWIEAQMERLTPRSG